MKPSPHPLPARLSYTEDDLLAYAHHVWVQYGMPCPAAAWDEAKGCLAENLPTAPAPCGGKPVRSRVRRPRTTARPSRAGATRRG